MRSPIWRTNISRSTFSRRAKNSPSVMMVPRLRYGSRYSLRGSRPLRTGRRASLRGRSCFSRVSRTLTTVMTPSSSMVSPGTAPSALDLRRRRRCVADLPSSVSPSELSCESLLVSTSSLLPGRRRPRPPLRRRRPRLALSLEVSSLDSLSGGATSVTFFRTGAFFSEGITSVTAALVRTALAGLASTGAA